MNKRQSCPVFWHRAASLRSHGFTLLEVCVVGLVMGVLAAIAVPTWLHLLNVMSLNTGQEQILQAMGNARQSARLSRVKWEFIIRQTADQPVQWAIRPAQTEALPPLWHDLDARLSLDAETSLQEVSGMRRIQFNYLGAVNGQLGRVTLSIKGGGNLKRCVIVSTLLGALRSSTEQSPPLDGKRCW